MMEIISVKYAESTLSGAAVFSGGCPTERKKIIFKLYVVKTEDRIILVDAGCESLPGFIMENHVKPTDALLNAGISPDSVTDLILTHAHRDHAECASKFKSARVYIQREELPRAESYLCKDAEICIFDAEAEVCDGVRVLKIGGHTAGSSIVEISLGGKIFVIAGDECYIRENLARKIPTGCSYSPEQSRFFIEKYSSEDYTVLLAHDE